MTSITKAEYDRLPNDEKMLHNVTMFARMLAEGAGYTVDEAGIIGDPGKFESEHVLVWYGWTFVTAGNVVTELSDGEAVVLLGDGPLEADGSKLELVVHLTEDEQGFVTAMYGPTVEVTR